MLALFVLAQRIDAGRDEMAVDELRLFPAHRADSNWRGRFHAAIVRLQTAVHASIPFPTVVIWRTTSDTIVLINFLIPAYAALLGPHPCAT